MALMMNKATIKRINKEITTLQKEDTGGIILTHDESNIHHWVGWLPGPSGTVYEGGNFEVGIELPVDYPFSPPKLRFKTFIYHCNVSKHGDICLDTLKSAWSPALSLLKVMLSLSALLCEPNEKDPLDGVVAGLYKSNRKEHDRLAREFTRQHAMTAEIRQKRKHAEDKSKPFFSAATGSSSSSSNPYNSYSHDASAPRPIASTNRVLSANSRRTITGSGSSANNAVEILADDDDDDDDIVLVDQDGTAAGRRVRSRLNQTTTNGGSGSGANSNSNSTGNGSGHQPIVID